MDADSPYEDALPSVNRRGQRSFSDAVEDPMDAWLWSCIERGDSVVVHGDGYVVVVPNLDRHARLDT